MRIFVALGLISASFAAATEPAARLTMVLELEAGRGVAADLAHALSEAELADLRKVGTGKIIGANDVRALLGFERERSLLGCKADTACYAEIGAAMGAKEIVTGSLAMVGDMYLVVLRRIDVSHTQVLHEATRTRKASDQAGLLSDLESMARELFSDAPLATPVKPAPGPVTAPAPSSREGLVASYRASCERGDGAACYNFGTFIFPDAPSDAAAAFAKGCELGAPLGCFRAAFVYQTGAKGLKKDPARGMGYMQRACDASTGQGTDGRALDGACLALSSYYLNGIGVTADPSRAVTTLKKLCDRGNDEGCAKLAHAELHGPDSVRNVAHGKQLSQDLCDHGKPEACNDAR